MNAETLTVGLITEIFPDPNTGALRRALANARQAGVELAVLPELPLDRWFPESQQASEDDAEPFAGPRQQRLSEAARSVRIAVLGGAVQRDRVTGRRHNTALLLGSDGSLLASYRKLVIPDEPGFWEARHYQPGSLPPIPFTGITMPLGIQICSDVNRPSGGELLAAAGAELIVVPRATPGASYPRWRLVLRSLAVTASAYVVSVNRPRPEGTAPIGGPSVVIKPDGSMLLETTEPLAHVTLQRSEVAHWRKEYPGYLSHPANVYAVGWQRQATG